MARAEEDAPGFLQEACAGPGLRVWVALPLFRGTWRRPMMLVAAEKQLNEYNIMERIPPG